jgi:thioredoxin-dependent peroxiredoxin
MSLTPGSPFPSFSLPDHAGALHSSESILGSPTIIYFYPKDDTSGCTTEACEFRDALPEFQGAKVFGISPDSAASHAKFAKRHGLNFPLLVDEDRTLIEAAGLWVEKSMYGKKYMGVERTTVLIGADGKIVKVWNKVKPAGHAAETLAALKELTS